VLAWVGLADSAVAAAPSAHRAAPPTALRSRAPCGVRCAARCSLPVPKRHLDAAGAKLGSHEARCTDLRATPKAYGSRLICDGSWTLRDGTLIGQAVFTFTFFDSPCGDCPQWRRANSLRSGPPRRERQGDVDQQRTVVTSGEPDLSAFGVLPAGRMIGGYRIEGRAGAGGMGVVYRAVDVELGRAVALKVIAPGLARDERFRERFRSESRRAAALEHPNVLPIYRSGEDDGALYIAMRFVDGASLQELIDRRGRLPVGAAVRIVSQVADALDAAHAAGLVHRDVKPGNVLISEADGEERASLTDFGLAIPVARQRAHGDGTYAGTPAYLAPEQIRGDPVDARTDVYGLGCLLFHALTGRVPFAATGVEAVMEAHLHEPPPSPSALVPGLPAKLDEVVASAMAKRPDDRFTSAGQLAEAARAARADVVISYDAGDEGAARSLAARLAEQGLEAHLARGDVADDLWSALACLLLVGRRDLAGWAREALDAAAAVASADPRFRLVPVLLPGAPDPFDARLAHLAGRTFVDLRAGTDDPHTARDLMRAVGAASPEVVRSPAEPHERCPYLGLEPFREEDAELFFGRDRETALLVEKLGAGRFLAVVGASGSGKSSLVRAGLVPRLRAADGALRVVTLTPGAGPLGALAAQLAAAGTPGAPTAAQLADDVRALDRASERSAAAGPGARLLVVVDQLEELFTLTRSASERRAFIDCLVHASTIPGGRAAVVVTMRSDFYSRCADHPALRELVAEHQLLVGPPGPDGLRDAIEGPARLAGLELEPGLVRRILADVSTEPGALPLLEHLLLELWRRRRGRLLTLEAYTSCGGVGGALARRANEVYGGLSADQQAIARRVLLRLTQPGEGTEDTRRRAPLAELSGSGPREDVERVLEAMSGSRLVVVGTDEATGEPVVEVTHEALIRAWPELRGWIDADREALRLHRRLTDAARDWDAAGREEGLLYRGARLAVWEERGHAELNDLERGFLAAGTERAGRERAARRRRIRLAIGGLAVATAAIAAVAVVALAQWRSANQERDVARSGQLAATATLAQGRDPELALILADRAYRAAPSAQAEQALRQAAHASRVRGRLRDFGTPVADLRSLGGGRVLVEGRDGSLRVWDQATDRGGTRAVDLGRWDGAPVWGAVAETPSGLVTGGADGSVVLWADGAPPRAIGNVGASVWDVTPVEGGRAVLVAADKGVWRWDLAAERGRRLLSEPSYRVRPGEAAGALYVSRSFAAQGEAPIVRWQGGRSAPLPVDVGVNDLEVSPDGRLLAVATENGVSVFRTGPRPQQAYVRPLAAPGANDVAFSDDGRMLAIASSTGAFVLAARSGAELAELQGHRGLVTAAAFAPGGRLVTGGEDGTALTWDWRRGVEPTLGVAPRTNIGAERFAADGSVTIVDLSGATRVWDPAGGVTAGLPAAGGPIGSAAMTPDRRVVVTGAADHTRGRILARDAAGRTLLDWSAGAHVWAVAVDPSGRRMAAALDDGRVVAASLRPASEPRLITRYEHDADSVAIDPTGRTVASGAGDGEVRLSGPGGTRTLGRHDGTVVGLAFSPDGSRLASAGFDKTARVWDVAGQEPAVVLRGEQGPVYAVAFAPDGDRLVSGGDGGLRVWDWRRGTTLLALPGGAFQVDAHGPAPRILRLARGPRGGVVSIVDCDVCGSIDDVRALVSERTTRGLSEQERADYLGGGG
jgi:WD40 repeat protein